MIRTRVWLVVVMLACGGSAFAQDAVAPPPERIGLFAADVRVSFPNFKGPAEIATALGVDEHNLPNHGFGLVFGAHFYPLHMGAVTLGLGAELSRSRATRSQEPTSQGATPGPTTETKFSALSPQVSLNFGGKNGWSYLSGGLGWGTLTTQLEAKPLPDANGSVSVLNYGGGARWFTTRHLAVSLDLRFYTVSAQEAAPGRPAYPKTRLIMASAGIALK